MPTVEAVPAVQHGIKTAKDILQNKGYELIPFTFSKEEVEEARAIFYGLIANNVSELTYKRLIDFYEMPNPGMKRLFTIFRMGLFTKWFLRKILEAKGNKR